MDPQNRDAMLVWAVFVLPPVLVVLGWLASELIDIPFSINILLIFTAAWGITSSAVSLWTGQFIYRPMGGHSVAHVAYGVDHPWPYRFYIASFVAMALWGLGKLALTAI